MKHEETEAEYNLKIALGWAAEATNRNSKIFLMLGVQQNGQRYCLSSNRMTLEQVAVELERAANAVRNSLNNKL